MLASGTDPTWDLSAMFGLHNVPSAHSFPCVKQDRTTCRRYMRTSIGLPDNAACVSWSMCTSNPSVFASCSLELGRGILYRLSQSRKVAAHAVEWRNRRLDRSAHIARGTVKEARAKPRMRTYTTYDVHGRSYKFRSNERLGWLAPARQLLYIYC